MAQGPSRGEIFISGFPFLSFVVCFYIYKDDKNSYGLGF